MKTRFLPFIAPLVLTSALAQDDVSFIRQIEDIDGVPVATDIPLDDDVGQVVSNAIEGDLTVFQLYTTWTKKNGNTELVMLDEEAVGGFLPEVTIETASYDPYVPTTTRSDQPYGVRLTVAGLNDDPLLPDYARTVLIGRGFTIYSPATYTPTADSGFYPDAWVYQGNGILEDMNVFHRIPDGTPGWAVGTEHYSVFTHPDSLVNLELASAEVIVWPMAFAQINGLTSGETYFDFPEDSHINLGAAYPRSTTYVQIYKGPQSADADGAVIPSTITSFGMAPDHSNVPQSATLPLGSIADYYNGDGSYTLEVRTLTPFNGGAPEVLSSITINVDRTLEFTGSIGSQN